jgi:hypothetical protein
MQPTPILIKGVWCSWLSHALSMREVPGSIPVSSTFYFLLFYLFKYPAARYKYSIQSCDVFLHRSSRASLVLSQKLDLYFQLALEFFTEIFYVLVLNFTLDLGGHFMSPTVSISLILPQLFSATWGLQGALFFWFFFFGFFFSLMIHFKFIFSDPSKSQTFPPNHNSSRWPSWFKARDCNGIIL